jgi:LPXTG-site transpeptidase (sortase) family protein
MSKAAHSSSRPPVNRADLIRLYRRALVSGVSFENLDEKIKESWLRTQVTDEVEQENDLSWQTKLWGALPAVVRWGAALVPAVMILAGIGLVGSAVWPIATYYVQSLSTKSLTAQLIAPVPQEKILDVVPLVVADGPSEGEVAGDFTDSSSNELDPIVVDAKLDYTNLNNWFSNNSLPFIQGPDLTDENITEYRLDIPKVEIVNAVVKVGTDDLNKNLIQYQGTALPGKAGSPVIFGHSILRQFYNPKETNPRRYMSIFSKIMTLQKGDRIYLTVNGAQYTYVVEEKTEVQPTDTYILAQRYDVKQLKLVTCVPEGTYLRRGVVSARLVTND